jgi:Fic family protein
MKDKDLIARSRTDAARRRSPHVHQSYIIPVLSKALVIIEVLKNSERPLNVDELTTITGIAKSTVYRILRTLSAYGYLPSGADGIYSFRRVPQLQSTNARTD